MKKLLFLAISFSCLSNHTYASPFVLHSIVALAGAPKIMDTKQHMFGITGGNLNIVAPSVQKFRDITPSAFIQQLTTPFTSPLILGDYTGSPQGYRISISSTIFSDRKNQLSAGSLQMKAPESIDSIMGDINIAPVAANGTYTIDGIGPISLLLAEVGNGAGRFTINFPIDALNLTISPHIALGAYQSILTFSIAIGP